jgi:membrane-bound lytic murein transglycosylase A
LAREALTNARRLKLVIAVLCVAAAGQAMMPLVVMAAHRWRAHPQPPPRQAVRALPYPKLDLPPEIADSQYFPMSWSDIPGWTNDDQLAAYQTFRASC